MAAGTFPVSAPLDADGSYAGDLAEVGAYSWVIQCIDAEGRVFVSDDVDQRITVFGQDVHCGCDWTVPVEDMARFGIIGIEGAQGYGSELAYLSKPVAWLTLDDHPAYAATIDAARAASGRATP